MTMWFSDDGNGTTSTTTTQKITIQLKLLNDKLTERNQSTVQHAQFNCIGY